jgi:hypothetical protein
MRLNGRFRLAAGAAVTTITAATALLAIPALASASAPTLASVRNEAQAQAQASTAPKRPASVSAAASPGTALAGTPVTLSATVKSARPSTAPQGTVTFWTGKTKLCSGKLSHASTHCTAKFTVAGDYVVRAAYSGDARHAQAVGQARITATRAVSTTAVSVSTLSPAPGESVTLAATVSSRSPLAATGTVRFTSGKTTLCTGRLSGGSARCAYAWQADGGRYVVTGTYAGDGAHAGSSGASGVVRVHRSATVTQITSISPARVPAGTSATVTVTVTSTRAGAPPATGTVTVAPNDPTLTEAGYSCTVTLTAASNGTGTCQITPPAPTYGFINYDATYSGDRAHSGSAYTGGYLVIVPDVTTTAVAFDPAEGTVGTPDTITATVTNQAGDDISPTAGGTGTVTFSIGGTTIAGCSDVALTYSAATGNTATCSYTPTTAGSVTVTATYSGDDVNLTSSDSEMLTSS